MSLTLLILSSFICFCCSIPDVSFADDDETILIKKARPHGPPRFGKRSLFPSTGMDDHLLAEILIDPREIQFLDVNNANSPPIHLQIPRIITNGGVPNFLPQQPIATSRHDLKKALNYLRL
ncbi:hypothetical protein Ddc_00540 [Ditylenchus destructor]|nr:hypothetical protein Ddc_00540 [Ditylenchus destructor]